MGYSTKIQTGVNGAFAANPNGGDVFIDAICLCVVHIVPTLYGFESLLR